MPEKTSVQVVRHEIAKRIPLTLAEAIVRKRNDVAGTVDVTFRGSPAMVRGVRVIDQVRMGDLTEGNPCLIAMMGRQWFCIATYPTGARQVGIGGQTSPAAKLDVANYDIKFDQDRKRNIGELLRRVKNLYIWKVIFGSGDSIEVVDHAFLVRADSEIIANLQQEALYLYTDEGLVTTGIWVGATAEIPAPFHVASDGAMTATLGSVGGWELSDLSLGGMDPRATSLEIISAAFRWVSWAQFAIYDNFDDATRRADPDPSTYDASIDGGVMTNGRDLTPGRVLGWYSKIYTDITTVDTGTSTDVGSGYLEDSAADWFADQYKSYVLVDSASGEFAISGCTVSPRRLTVTGTPAAGAYSIRATDPTYCAAFASYTDDSTGDGYGYTKIESSFDNGVNWQTLLDTEASVNNLGGAVAIVNTGHDYQFRASVKNDALGKGAVIHNVIVCTDPSLWG